MKTSVIWFKTDLRLTDNETLMRAITHSDSVVPVYCFDDAHFETSSFGFKKTGSFRAQFLLEALFNLDHDLRKLGSGLIIVKGKPEVEIPKVVAQYKATVVYAKREVGYEEKQLEQLVQKELFKLRCDLETFSTSTLYHAADLPFSIKDIPDVFTTFRKKTEKDATVRGIFGKPTQISSPQIPPAKFPTLEELGLAPKSMDERAAIHFVGGESQALDRLQYYFFESKHIARYKETRNGLVGADYSSKFSPWLALGCISPRFIYHELKKYEAAFGANESTYWLVFELLWRDFFRFMFKKHGTGLFLAQGIKSETMQTGKLYQKVLQQWIEGETDEEFVNANMIELKATGFMSNRGRQIVASYLCNDLNLDWRAGASYFEQELIDYDACSNWGNWAYIAGVGNDPRQDRYFNIEKQATTYDKQKTYRNLWLTSAC